MHKLRPLIVLIILAAIAGGGYWYLQQNPQLMTDIKLQLGLITPAEAAGIYMVSGYIEADEISVAPETQGRITALLADEGDTVTAGQTVALLDTALLDAQIRQAQAKVDTANAQLARVKAGIRAEEIARAEAAVAVAQAAADAASVRLQDATTLRDNPQELDVQIEAAQTALELSDLQVNANIPLKDAGETMWNLGKQRWEYVQDPQRHCFVHPVTGQKSCMTFHFEEGLKQDLGVAWNFAGADMWQAWVNLNTSMTTRDDAQTRLNDLLTLRNNPQAAQVQVAQAEAAYQSALAQVDVAQAQVTALESAPRAEQVSLAEAGVAQAQAALVSLENDRAKHTLTAPMDGWVTQRIANEGEMAAPGVSLISLANLGDLTLTVYVPEPDVGMVEIGQQVDVFVDTFPGEPFTGKVSHISDQAEFTPKNVQTKEERVNTVFAVKIKLDNSDLRLRPGMPADAVLGQVAESGNQNTESRSQY